MRTKKYELTSETKEFLGRTLYRIRALVSFGDVEAGDLGGWIEKEENLAQGGDAWVYGNAVVSGDAWVYGNARVSGNARVYGNAVVSGDAVVSGNARVYGNAVVSGDAWVYGNARVYGNAVVSGDAWVYDNARVYGNAVVSGDAVVSGNARVYGNAVVSGGAVVSGDAEVEKSTHLFQIGAIGPRDDFTTFVRFKDKTIHVVCGCFRGTIDEFADRVKEVHAGTKHEKTYMAAIELAKLQMEDVEV